MNPYELREYLIVFVWGLLFFSIALAAVQVVRWVWAALQKRSRMPQDRRPPR